jgi:hypothetical protein
LRSRGGLAKPLLQGGQGKYDVSRQLQAPIPTPIVKPTPLLGAA